MNAASQPFERAMDQVTAAAVNPLTFHMDCVDHLCRLENKLADVRDSSGPSPAKLDTLVGLLVEITDFSEPRFSPKVFEGVAERLHDLYERCKSLRESFSKGSSWSSLFGKPAKADDSSDEVMKEYAKLKQDLNRFLVEYFVICVKRFSTTSEDKRGFLESVDSFIGEVDRIWS